MEPKQPQELLNEIEFEGGKIVAFRNPTAGDLEQAAMTASGTVMGKDGNPMLFSMAVSKELSKLLLVSVNGKALSGIEKESYQSLFALDELNTLNEEMQSLMGKRKVVRRGTSKASGNK